MIITVGGLAVYARFDDLGLISRSRLLESSTSNFFFFILVHFSLIMHGCYKINYSMLCVTGVYLRNITDNFCDFAVEC